MCVDVVIYSSIVIRQDLGPVTSVIRYGEAMLSCHSAGLGFGLYLEHTYGAGYTVVKSSPKKIPVPDHESRHLRAGPRNISAGRLLPYTYLSHHRPTHGPRHVRLLLVCLAVVVNLGQPLPKRQAG